jgi:cyclopropane fatty-acyl-phospholipid synthase-like methyltransferase
MKEFWDSRFAAKEYVYGISPNDYFKQKLDGLEPGRLLLPGEGEGRNAVYAAAKGWQVDALDYSREGRRKALALAEQQGVEIHYDLADLETSVFGEEKYDAIAMVYAHFRSAIRKDFHQRIMNSLRPGGYLIMEAFSIKQLGKASGGPQNADLLYTPEMLRDDFGRLEMLELTESEKELREGSFHQGMAEVISLFGFKK